MLLLPEILQLGELDVTHLLQVLEHPLLVAVTVYVPADVTVMLCVVAPLLHKYEPAPADAVSCIEPPWQTELLPEIVQEGAEPTVMVLLQVL